MKKKSKVLSRRKFILGGSLAAFAAVASQALDSIAAERNKKKSKALPKKAEETKSLKTVNIRMTVNGVPKQMTVPAGKLLSDVLREDLHLTGVKIGCNAAECGSCTVIVNGRPVYSCRTLAALADGSVVETIEGISAGVDLHPIQKSFIDADALQCGYCTPGMICATKALFMRNPRPDEDQIRAGLAGNICRCGAYKNILKAVQAASKG